MGFIRIVIIILFIYLILRYIFRRLLKAFFLKPHHHKGNIEGEILKDKIVPCPTCGTYNPTKVALVVDGKHYCNEHCYQVLNKKM